MNVEKNAADTAHAKPEHLESPSDDGALASLEATSELSRKLADEVGIDEKQAEKAIRLVQQTYSGPIPFAAELRRYNEISPGLGTDIARDYLKDREHERECDRKALTLAEQDSNRKDSWLRYANRGQNFGMASQVLFVVAAFAALLLHQPVIAGMFIAPPALGLVAQFIKGIGQREASASPEPSPRLQAEDNAGDETDD